MRIIDPAEVERRRQALLELDRQRKRGENGWLSPNERRSATQKQNALRRARLEQQLPIHNACPQSETRVLVDWHRDETGCRARTVGCD